MSGTEPAGLLSVLIVHERPSENRVACHARCVSPGRGVFPGDRVLPADGSPDDGAAPARILRIHRQPFGEFTELTPGWSAVVELEAPEESENPGLSWVRPGADLRVVP
ncbi:hypothetical protein [Streptomyces sp. NPDC093970]|uniref:hypothetical protein n=1 Tax=Streptomyces sp. NPDC093970 TaxID=3155076 RepID=UPI003415AFBB